MAKKSRDEHEDYKKRAGRRALERGKKATFKLVPGPNCFRVLKTPAGKTSGEVFFEFAVHENVGPEKKYLRCGKDPEDNSGRCYICDKVIPRLRKRGKDARASALEKKVKFVVQVVGVKDDDGEPKFSKDIQLWYPAKKTGDTLMGSILTSKKRDYVDHRKGYNLNIERTGTGFKDTTYGQIEADEEPSKVPSTITEKLLPFDRLESIPVYDEVKMKKALGEVTDDDDEDAADESTSKKSKKRSSRDEDDDDSDDDEDDDSDSEDDDDEDEDASDKKSKKSKSKKSKSKSKSKDDDDDEDEDDDDEDEDSEDDEDEDDDDEEDDDEDDDDDSDDEEDDDEDEDDDDDKKSKSKSSKSKKSSTKKKKRR